MWWILYKEITEFFFLTQLIVSTYPYMLEWNCLYDMEMNMYFHAQC